MTYCYNCRHAKAKKWFNITQVCEECYNKLNERRAYFDSQKNKAKPSANTLPDITKTSSAHPGASNGFLGLSQVISAPKKFKSKKEHSE